MFASTANKTRTVG